MFRTPARPMCKNCGAPLPEIPGVPPEGLQEVAQWIAEDAKINAIKRVRELTRWGLAESKFYVECPHPVAGWSGVPEPAPAPAYGATETASLGIRCPVCGRSLPSLEGLSRHEGEVSQALARGNKIEAIKIVRMHTGCGLREAKEYIECPHPAPTEASPAVAPEAPVCPYCNVALPPLPQDRGEVRQRVHAALLQGRSSEAVQAAREHLGGDLKAARDYVFCPHRQG